jgi:hypothetical protein
VADFVADFVAGAFSVKWKKLLNFTKSPTLMLLQSKKNWPKRVPKQLRAHAFLHTARRS